MKHCDGDFRKRKRNSGLTWSGEVTAPAVTFERTVRLNDYGRATEELQVKLKDFSAGFLAVTTAVLAVLALPGQANAADPPKCQAPQGSSCLGLKNKISNVQSISVNGQCFPGVGNSNGSKRWPNRQYFVPDRLQSLSVQAFWNNECGTSSALPVKGFSYNVSYADGGNYVWLTINKR